jgi:hypothetical protein
MLPYWVSLRIRSLRSGKSSTYELLLRCRDCASAFIEKEEDAGRIPKCPDCAKVFKSSDLRESRPNTTNRLKMGQTSLRKVDFQTSTKLKALIKKLKDIAVQDPLYKALIFSQVSRPLIVEADCCAAKLGFA